MKRSALAPVSRKRAKLNRQRSAVIRTLKAERGSDCQLRAILGTACLGEIHGHEIVKRSAGGSIVDASLILLACDRHNGEVEDDPERAKALGLSQANPYQFVPYRREQCSSRPGPERRQPAADAAAGPARPGAGVLTTSGNTSGRK